MKSTNRTKKRQKDAKLNRKARFAGETLVTPLCFNPTAEQIKFFKGIRPDAQIDEPTYKRTMTLNDEKVEFSVVSLLCEFKPNEILGLEENKYSDRVFVSYEILVDKEQVVGNKSGKTQVIDEHNQTAWVRLGKRKNLQKREFEFLCFFDYCLR